MPAAPEPPHAFDFGRSPLAVARRDERERVAKLVEGMKQRVPKYAEDPEGFDHWSSYNEALTDAAKAVRQAE